MKSTCFPLKSTYFIIFSKVFPQFLGEILWFLWFLWHFSLPDGAHLPAAEAPKSAMPEATRRRCARTCCSCSSRPSERRRQASWSSKIRRRFRRRSWDHNRKTIMSIYIYILLSIYIYIYIYIRSLWRYTISSVIVITTIWSTVNIPSGEHTKSNGKSPCY